MIGMHERLRDQWQYTVDLVLEILVFFKSSPQEMQVIYILLFLLALAFVKFFITLTASKAASPFRVLQAPTRLPESVPPWFSIEKRLEYYMVRRYFSHCRPNRIGWFAPRLLIWTGSLGIFACVVLQGLTLLGLKRLNPTAFAYVFLGLLVQSFVIAYAHNARRVAELNMPRVPLFTFMRVFAVPLFMTSAVVGFELFKHHAFDVAMWVWQTFPLG
jgi:hypothetical protein